MIGAVRFSVLWIWIVTIFVILYCFIYKGTMTKMPIPEVIKIMSSVLAVVTPQITIMFSFVLKDSKNSQEKLISENNSLATLTLMCSIIYHASFWFLLWYGIINEHLGETMKDNADNLLLIMAFISIIGLSPVGFLFSSKASEKDSEQKKNGTPA